jgi:hypothetical protein
MTSKNTTKSSGKQAAAPKKTATATAPATDTNTAAAASPAPVVVNTAAPVALAAPESTGLRGTPEQLVKRGILMNNKPMGIPDFANLKKFHFRSVVEIVDHVPKAKGIKGKSTEILALKEGVPGFNFSFPA